MALTEGVEVETRLVPLNAISVCGENPEAAVPPEEIPRAVPRVKALM